MGSVEVTRPVGPRHPEVVRLRTLLGDAKGRAEERAFVLEGPRVLAGALDRGATIETVYLGPGAARAFAPLVERVERAAIRVVELREGVIEKVGRTVTPQPVLAVAPIPAAQLADLGQGLVLVAVGLADPGNAGTILRSAEAVGAGGVVFTGASVDPFNPKVVRASAGASFGVPVVVDADPHRVLTVLGDQGRHRVAAAVAGSTDAFSATWPAACAIVLGNEARGLDADLVGDVEELVSIPMRAGESLNVAMAATVLAYEWRKAHPA